MKKYKAVRSRLKEILNSKDISQIELAEHLGMTRSFITDKATMRGTLNINNAMTISKFLNCSIEELYEWDEEEI